MTEIVTAALMLLGGLFMVLSAIGVVRMPDVYMRLQVASKASSLGAGCLMAAVALHFAELGIVVRALLVVVFIFMTTPVSAHLIGRAAYLTGVRLWDRSGQDDLADAYDRELGTLRGTHGGASRDES
jgi:multicomponent Na+:H+ antiporter subunit G